MATTERRWFSLSRSKRGPLTTAVVTLATASVTGLTVAWATPPGASATKPKAPTPPPGHSTAALSQEIASEQANLDQLRQTLFATDAQIAQVQQMGTPPSGGGTVPARSGGGPAVGRTAPVGSSGAPAVAAAPAPARPAPSVQATTGATSAPR